MHTYTKNTHVENLTLLVSHMGVLKTRMRTPVDWVFLTTQELNSVCYSTLLSSILKIQC